MLSSAPQLYPYPAARQSVEHLFHRHHKPSQLIYVSLLLLLLGGFISLFFIRVDVSVQSTGLIKSLQERAEIKAITSGIIDSVFVTENQQVEAGAPLLKINAAAVDERQQALATQDAELALQVTDLEKLVAGRYDSLQSMVYTEQYALYRQRLADAQLRLNLVQKNYNRYYDLYRSKVISEAEFDKYSYEKQAVSSEIALMKQQQLAQWQTALTQLRLQRNQLGASSDIAVQQQGLYLIKAPISGTIQQLKGIQSGSLVSANELLAELSPVGGLIAETYVLPKDIGYLKNGNPVRLQVDAFDYNVWGVVTGKVQSISDDIFVENGQPLFKVRCVLDRPELQLKNGYRGRLKKGMTVQARFLVTRRSLYQLLYDKADNWLNPHRNTHA